MSDETMLAALMEQAEAEGARLPTLRGVIEEASELGARRALAALARCGKRDGLSGGRTDPVCLLLALGTS